MPSESPLHILSGSFSSLSLFLLAFSPSNRTIHLVQRVPALGPHQFLAVSPQSDTIYATSWALPPALSSWAVQRPAHGDADDAGQWALRLVNTAPITATSSYIALPPPYTHLYSAGGPTGEVHRVDAATRGLAAKTQEVLFVPPGELAGADKTRAALRYGAHAVEVSARGHAFVPVLGTDSIHMYAVARASGRLARLATASARPGAGPRHVVAAPDGRVLYAVTEHTSVVDVYSVSDAALTLVQSATLLPRGARAQDFRGDTLRLRPPTPWHPAPKHLFATTRGAGPGTRGYLAVFALGADGLLRVDGGGAGAGEDVSEGVRVERWETPTSGGRANAIELRAREGGGVWVVLTDDAGTGPGVRVLEWRGEGAGIEVVACWPEEGGEMEGGSHAVWLD